MVESDGFFVSLIRDKKAPDVTAPWRVTVNNLTEVAGSGSTKYHPTFDAAWNWARTQYLVDQREKVLLADAAKALRAAKS